MPFPSWYTPKLHATTSKGVYESICMLVLLHFNVDSMGNSSNVNTMAWTNTKYQRFLQEYLCICFYSSPLPHTHTPTHTETQHTHTHTHTLIPSPSHTHPHTHTHTPSHTDTHTHTHTHTHTRTRWFMTIHVLTRQEPAINPHVRYLGDNHIQCIPGNIAIIPNHKAILDNTTVAVASHCNQYLNTPV